MDFPPKYANSSKINEHINNQNDLKHQHIDFFHSPNQNIYGFTSIFFDRPKSNFTQKAKKNSATNDFKLVTTPSTNVDKNYKILEQENHGSPAKEAEISNTTTLNNSTEEIEETKTTTTVPLENNY